MARKFQFLIDQCRFQGRFLYNQLRPEFVKRYSKSLSSDGVSTWKKFIYFLLAPAIILFF